MRRQLEARGGPPGPMNPPPQHVGPPQQPPQIGTGNTVIGQIVSGQIGQGGLAPPPHLPQQEQQPPHMPPAPPGLQGPPPPPPPPSQQPPFQQYPQGPAPGGFPPQPPPSTASPGPGSKRAIGRPPAAGPATPQINTPVPYNGPGQSPQVPTHPTPDHARMVQHPPPPLPQTNNLGDLDVERLPNHIKKVRDDWFAIFNQHVPRALDVELVHTLQHESVVCCVRFSHDGKYVATGCNRSAQIYDVATGEKVSVLQDESIDVNGDLYIRSVCFSPDGRYLATGAEDKLIRVSISVAPHSAPRDCVLIRPGLGYPSKGDPEHVPWSRARYLLA